MRRARSPIKSQMRRCSVSAHLAAAVLLLAASSALADGPPEPNDNPSQAGGPLTAAGAQATIDSADDVDWFKFYPEPRRRVYLVATTMSPCPSGGTVRMDLNDADQPAGVDYLGYLTLTGGSVQFPFEAVAGHRYFVKVTNTNCAPMNYSLKLSPGALRTTLVEKLGCTLIKREARREHGRYLRLRAQWQRAQGASRKRLRSRMRRQRDLDLATRAHVAPTCRRRPVLAGSFG